MSLAVLVLSIAAIGVAHAAALIGGGADTWHAWVMAMAIPFSMVSIMTLGAARAGKPHGGLRRLAIPFATVLVLMLAAFALAFALPGANEPLVLGLPLRAAIVLYGIGVIPVFILPVAYAMTFDEITLTEDDIEQVRQAAMKAESQR